MCAHGMVEPPHSSVMCGSAARHFTIFLFHTEVLCDICSAQCCGPLFNFARSHISRHLPHSIFDARVGSFIEEQLVDLYE